MHTFAKGQLIYRNSIPFCIVRIIDNDVQLENTQTGALSNHKLEALLAEYVSLYLCTATHQKHKNSRHSPSGNSIQDLTRLSDANRAESRRRVDYIVKLLDAHAFDSGKKKLEQAIRDISKFMNDKRAPHVTTIYRWRILFMKAKKNFNALFSNIEKRGGKNRSRLDPIVEGIIDEKIESTFLSNKSGCAEDVHTAVLAAVSLENTKRIESEWLTVPGLRTIQRRIETIYGYDIAVAKYGFKEAERRYGYVGLSRKVSRILELVEIDHTPVDIMVVNEDRVVIGRPMFTVVLDRFSRCILGYNLTLSTHGTPGVFEALRHALLPKTYLQDHFADLNLTWECFGWFEKLLMDNGREFHADAVTDALLSLGIITEYSASRSPNDKPFVERFLKTFNYSFIHKLPGTTLSKLHKRIGFKAEDDACITLAELDRLIHVWILSKYHMRPHFGLKNRSPIEVWRESAQMHPPQLKANAADVEIEFCEVATSSVQHYGIDLNNQRYASVRLSNLRRMLPAKQNQVDVKWPRNDLGRIYVWDAFENEYFKVPNLDESVHGLTLDQVKAVEKAEAGNPEIRRVTGSAIEVVNEIVATAQKDKKLKIRRKAERLNNTSAKNRHLPVPNNETVVSKSQIVDDATVMDSFEYAIESMSTEGGTLS